MSSSAGRQLTYVSLIVAELVDAAEPGDPTSVLTATARVAALRVGGVGSASITMCDDRGHVTAVSTGDQARRADQLQYQCGNGPALAAIATRRAHQIGNNRADIPPTGGPWGELAERLADELDVRSVLSVPLGSTVGDRGECAAGLNLYANPAGAFGSVSVQLAGLLSRFAGMAWHGGCSAVRAENLSRAVASTTQVGPAIGMVMAQLGLDHDTALNMLRTHSQYTNRKVHDLAADMVKTGSIPSRLLRLVPRRP